ncbi:protein SIEVE ELEMENT OCCLUSION B-like [Ipomoea triloba]|uniref:protein SIEVE ELEMENT OCCLUSION B-like n=1 Tax=Ipomoea triloba TaxID=35885 RepID=UPI00125D8CF7|nr:protein SIEVE ELEMENT OCCLUSION B-like [Ipomoea triloba]
MEYQPLVGSSINENIILEEVLRAHGSDGKGFKTSYVLNFVKKILFSIYIMIAGEIIHEDEESEDSDNDEKFDEKESDDKKKSNEEEFDEEPKDMELSYQIKRLSFEMSLMCSNKMDSHLAVIYFMKMLSTFSWEGKLLMMLAVFSLNFGEFSLVHGHKGLARKLSILRGSETLVVPPHIPEMVTNFIKSILQLTDCIVELAQSSSHNSSPIIPIACYWIFTNLLVYASYFTRLPSMDSKWLIIEETQLYDLTAKIKDIITDCRPILDKKREEDCYKALCYAFSYENPIPFTNNNLDVLKLLFNVKNGGKKKLLYDGKSEEMVKLCSLKDQSLLLLISPNLNIDPFLLRMLKGVQDLTKVRIVWIPIFDYPELLAIKQMEEQYGILVEVLECVSVINPQKSVSSCFVRFVKEKWFPTFQTGGDPIIVSLDHHGRIVHHNAMYMILMLVGDVIEGIKTGVEIGESIIPSLQNMLKERTLAIRSVMPDIDRKLDQIVGNMERVMIEGLDEIGKQIQNLATYTNIFTSEMEKHQWKIQTWCFRLVGGITESKADKFEDDKNELCILIGGNNIKWVKTFLSSVLSKICFNPLLRFEVEMIYVGSNMKVASMVDDKFKIFDEPDEAENLFSARIVWSRLENLFLSRIKFLDETHGDEESDEIAKGLKLLLAYEGNGLGVYGWAMLCKGNEIVVCDLGEKMLTVVNEYEKWKESAIAKGFDKAFKDVHHMLGSTSTSQHHPCCTLEYPSNFDKTPKNVKCPQCCRNMQKLIAFRCYHGHDCLLDDDDDNEEEDDGDGDGDDDDDDAT